MRGRVLYRKESSLNEPATVPGPKRKGSSSKHHFGAMIVFCRCKMGSILFQHLPQLVWCKFFFSWVRIQSLLDLLFYARSKDLYCCFPDLVSASWFWNPDISESPEFVQRETSKFILKWLQTSWLIHCMTWNTELQIRTYKPSLATVTGCTGRESIPSYALIHIRKYTNICNIYIYISTRYIYIYTRKYILLIDGPR